MHIIRHISYLDKVLFMKHLSVLLGSGASLPESLMLLSEETRSPAMREVILSLVRGVEGGHPFSGALERSGAFPPHIIRIIRAGEASGRLEEELKHIAIQLTKDMDIRRKIRGALYYPILILSAAALLAGWLGFYILPKLSRVFLSLNIPFPLPTRMLLWIVRQISEHGAWIAAGFFILIFFMIMLFRLERAKIFLHRFALIIPVIGVFVQDIYLARLMRTLASLMKGGVPLNEALALCAESLKHSLYHRALSAIRDSVVQGKTLSSGMKSFPLIFPLGVSHMIAVCERSGSLEDLLFYLANYYEEEVDASARNFSTVIEPLLLILLGLGVLWLGLAIMLPIAQMYGSLAK